MNTSDPEYCRQIEAYLCRKNDGHLVRIVGPAFERVCEWAEKGVPLKVAFRGIDRYFERYYRKGPRRRPVRVEFCEADVLDVFDEWRRAVGVLVVRETHDNDPGESCDGARAVSIEDGLSGDDAGAYVRHRGSLPTHLDRVIARLKLLRGERGPLLDEVLEGVVRELEGMRAAAKGLRGSARQAVLDRLRALDVTLLEKAQSQTDAAVMAEISTEAEAELLPFRERMPPDAYAHAMAACVTKIIRERARLPTLVLE